MAEEKKSLGVAIDEIMNALEPLDEKGRETAIYAVCMQLGITKISLANSGQAVRGNYSSIGAESESGPLDKIYDIRSFADEKKPKNAQQMACVVAFYLSEYAPENERKDAVTISDIEKYFKQARFRLPKKLEGLLVDAKRSGYFETVGRGAYKLNAVGYNLVAHALPIQNEG